MQLSKTWWCQCFDNKHYQKTLIRRVPESLPWAFFRAHGKQMICRASKKTHGKHQTHGEPRSSPCVKPQAHDEHESRASHATLSSGTRLYRHTASRPSVFAMCQSQAHGELQSSPCDRGLAHGELSSAVKPPDGTWRMSWFVVCPRWHTANLALCRVPGPGHTTNINERHWPSLGLTAEAGAAHVLKLRRVLGARLTAKGGVCCVLRVGTWQRRAFASGFCLPCARDNAHDKDFGTRQISIFQ